MKVETVWDSEVEEKPNTSYHVPIDPEAKNDYDAWVANDCKNDWWYKKKEIEQAVREQAQRDKEKILWLNAECKRLEREIKN